jgi:prephenate dehydrogenase
MKTKDSDNVAIIGLGLLGASLALALKEAGRPAAGWTRNSSARETLLTKGAINSTAERVEDVLKAADIVILCMPVPQIVEFCVRHAKDFKRGAIVSDVGSVKGPMMETALPALEAEGCVFIGGHPMAGSERSGHEAANAALFKKATVFLTPGEGACRKSLGKLRALWEMAGGVVEETDAATHDALVARSSHLPHALAWCLASTALDVENGRSRLAQLACASSFRDMTRVSASSPELWTGIFESNRESVLDAIDEFQGRLEELRDALESGDSDALKGIMEKGRSLRERWASAQSSK